MAYLTPFLFTVVSIIYYNNNPYNVTGFDIIPALSFRSINILCGMRLLTQDVYRKEKPSLAMFISTSNEHILDKTMVKIC
jgi:hypothetical protein